MASETPDFQAYCGAGTPRFANDAELECAKLLDYYRVPWEYEPRTFVLEEAEDGTVIEAFRPDFYLPDQDLYLEVTVMKQSLVTRKNRKLRKLRERYPDVKVKLFYKRDIQRLVTDTTSTRVSVGLGMHRPVISDGCRAEPGILEASQAMPRLIRPDELGEVYLSAEEIRARVSELGAEIARDYEGREPILVSSLKTSVFFLADLSRAVPIAHAIDFIALAGYVGRTKQSGVRLIKDLDVSITGRDVLLVEDVVDTGLTLNYVCRTLSLREPASLAAVTFLDRPYRRLVDDLPVKYIGFTVPDEFFVGYGFDLDERYRHLPDLHLARRAS